MLMANTVNDVMNVIASPDYGIKNIAGTNQEILAILQGTHNSKNNIHSIVDDVRNLLQKLVSVSTEKKPIEVGDKFVKTNHKNIQTILDETKGIRKAIDNLAKILEKQSGRNMPAVAKLSEESSESVAKAMIKDIEKQKKGGGMAALVDAFTKLKDISLKDLIFGKKKIKLISNIFKNAREDLRIDEKELAAIIKLINAAPEMVTQLSKINRKVNKIIKNDTIKKLGDILVGENSILIISQSLEKNEKVFNNARKTSKDIQELLSSLKKTMRKLFFASLWAKLANSGTKSIENILDRLFPISKKLSKNKKDIETGVKAAIKMTALVGNLLVTSIFLTIAVVTGIPAILGAIFLGKMIDRIIPAVRKLSRNKKHISKAIGSALLLVTVTGIMAITSFMLATIALTGIPALLGSVLMVGIIYVNIFAFKLLSKSLKTIAIGAISMAIMSLALLLFSTSLEKITNATKDVTFKQVGIIASLIVLLGGSVAALGIPAVFPFILLGSISVAIMGFALRPFATTLEIIAKATAGMKMKHIFLVAGAMTTLAFGISGLALLLPGVLLGSITLRAMVKPLATFVATLKMIKEMKSVPTKQVSGVLSAMRSVGNFFKANKLKLKVIRNARRYAKIMPPFVSAAYALSAISKMESAPTKVVSQALDAIDKVASFYRWNDVSYDAIWNARAHDKIIRPFKRSVYNLSKLKEMGSIPLKLVHQALDAMRIISKFYIDNELDRYVIRIARRYGRMMRPFSNIISKLVRLKEMGSLPTKLVHQALGAMKLIADYYTENEISWETIRASWRYGIMLRPFGYTIKKLSKLKELGMLPTRLVTQTLNAMKSIGEYYANNEVSRDTIKASWRYALILRPFGYTIKQFVKLKELGTLPKRLVDQTLEAMGTVVDFYQSRQMEFRDAFEMKFSAIMISSILKNFGQTIDTLRNLKELREVPINSVNDVLGAVSDIIIFYMRMSNTYIDSDTIDSVSETTKMTVNKFINMSVEMKTGFDKLKNIKVDSVRHITQACRNIIDFYVDTKHYLNKHKVRYSSIILMNTVLTKFAETAKYIKSIPFSNQDYSRIVGATNSMSEIMMFFKSNTLNLVQIIKAHKNLNLINRFSFAVRNLSNIRPTNISSIGDALSNTLSGGCGYKYV